MAKRRISILSLLLCLCLCLMPCTATAASTVDAKEPIATDAACTLTIGYGYDGTTFADQTVQLYRIAEVSSDFRYALTAPFAATGLIVNDVQTNGEWNVIRSTLETHIVANRIAPTQTAVTNPSGQVCFSQLTPGLYLAAALTVTREDLIYAFDAALVALPGLGTDGLWQYAVTVAAKAEVSPSTPPEQELHLKVLKLWKGDEGRTDRPRSIEVEIFRDGVSYQIVTLSEENHWSYSWTAKADGADWKASERNVPEGYTMTVEQRESAFVLTNALNSPDPPIDPPQTGDTSRVWLYIILSLVSGCGMVIFGMLGKRKSV